MREEGHSWSEPSGTADAANAGPANGAWSALALIEIGGFRDLRRFLGVARADLLVLDLAERLAAAAPAASVAPIGRNLIEARLARADRAAVDAALGQLRGACAEPVTIDGVEHRVGAVFAAAVVEGAQDGDLALLEQAEERLDAARRTATLPAVAASAHDDARLSRDIQGAIARDELFLQYQPKLHLRRQAIVSIEALIRWQHPRLGLVMPGDFISAIERTGDIVAVTLWTIRQAIVDQRALRRNGYDLPVFINISGVLLSNKGFIDAAAGIVRESGAKLGFEITETSVIRDPDSAIRHLQELAAIGVEISIDDYGAGLSSLAYLKQLPATELKIDKLFVTQLTSSHRDPLIVRSTIDLAHALEMEVVAEGVETPTSLALLSVMCCDLVQGFLISRPLALEALLAYLREERHVGIAQRAQSPVGRLSAVRARG